MPFCEFFSSQPEATTSKQDQYMLKIVSEKFYPTKNDPHAHTNIILTNFSTQFPSHNEPPLLLYYNTVLKHTKQVTFSLIDDQGVPFRHVRWLPGAQAKMKYDLNYMISSGADKLRNLSFNQKVQNTIIMIDALGRIGKKRMQDPTEKNSDSYANEVMRELGLDSLPFNMPPDTKIMSKLMGIAGMFVPFNPLQEHLDLAEKFEKINNTAIFHLRGIQSHLVQSSSPAAAPK